MLSPVDHPSSQRSSRAGRKVLASLLVVACALGVFSIWTPMLPNLGLPIGYYGGYNQVLRALEQRPDLEVIEVARHQDITLEDFWVHVRTGGGRNFTLAVVDGGAVRAPDDPARGVVVFEDSQRGRMYPFNDDDFWRSWPVPPPGTLRQFLPLVEAFLEAHELQKLPVHELDWQETADYIQLWYNPALERPRPFARRQRRPVEAPVAP